MTTTPTPESGTSKPVLNDHQFSAYRLSGRAYMLGALCRAANFLEDGGKTGDANWLTELAAEIADEIGSKIDALALQLSSEGGAE